MLVARRGIVCGGRVVAAAAPVRARMSTAAGELVEVAEAASLIRNGARVVDCSASVESFARARVAGARRLPVDPFLKAHGSSHMMGPAELSALAQDLRLHPDTPVVLYDGGNAIQAARVWWVLTYYGFKHVHVLNGGWMAVVAAVSREDAAGRVGMETGAPPTTDPVPATSVTLTVARPDVLATAGEVKEVSEALQSGASSTQLLDLRSPAEYAGVEMRTNRRGGHVPGVNHLPHMYLFDTSTGKFKTPAELSTLFRQTGLDPSKRVVTYCQAGVRAAAGALALRSAGFTKVANYDGSMQEWMALPDSYPVVK